MKTTSRNFNLGVLNGVLYIFSETMLDPTLVLVAFISQLTSSPILLGLVVPLRDGSWALPQLWVSGFLQTLPLKMDFYKKMSYVRIASWGALALGINFLKDPTLLLVTFFVAYGIGAIASGMSGLPFLEVVGKTIPAERRGEFFAWRFGLGGLLSIGASMVVRWLIDPAGPLPFPANYGVLATIFFVFASISLLLYNGVEEPPDLHPRPRASLLQQLRAGFCFVRDDANYRRFMVMQSTLMSAGMATPFFAVYVQQQLGGSKAMVGVYLAITMVSNLLANIFFGRMSRRVGNRKVMVTATVAGAAMSILVLLLALLAGPLGIPTRLAELWLVPVFVLSAFRATGIGVAANSLLLDITPPTERSVYMGFNNTFQGLVLLGTSISGVILVVIGFIPLVLIALLAHGLALYFAGRIRQ